MKLKELTKTFMMISNWKKPFGLHSLYKKYFSAVGVDPLTAGAAYIRVFILYWHIKYHILKMLKNKCDINQHDLKRIDLYFVKSE